MGYRSSIVALGLLVTGSVVAQEADVAAGKVVYDKYCSQCHGDEGDGQGVAAPYMKPKPRDFTSGKYKVRGTPTGYLPTDEDMRRSVRIGLPYSTMPAFEGALSEQQIDDVVQYIKTFAPRDFEDPDAYSEPIALPNPPAWTEASAERGKELYVKAGCVRCHGELGYGDGSSAPTLVDDWGDHIRPADLALPWTFRGGGSRRDIYRTMATGFAGTPMPGYHGALPEEDIWGIVDFISGLADNQTEAPYTDLLTAVGTTEDLDLSRADELFANAPESLFPVVGQIIEPGRSFYPSATAVAAQAVYNDQEIAIRVSWHDMRAETSGTNGLDLQAPLWMDELQALAEQGGDSDDDPAAVTPDLEFNDAVAVQFPLNPTDGIRKPYFLFGDVQNPVELWYVQAGSADTGTCWEGRGSAAVTPGEAEPPQVISRFEQGEWSIIFKRQRQVRNGVSFAEGTFTPVAFSVWDGFNRERGNKRGLTAWYSLYLDPMEKPSPIGPMVKTALTVLGVELLLIALVRRAARRRKDKNSPPAGALEPSGA